MNKLLLTVGLALCALFTQAQPFEGKITYQNTYKSKVPMFTDAKVAAMMGTVETYYVKGGDYKAEMNGSLMQYSIYINKENKLYTKMSNSPTIKWEDAAVNADSVLKTELHPAALTILGYKCDELILHCKSGTQTYYFSAKLPVDSKLYVKHKNSNWYTYLAKANAVPLKIIIDNPRIHIESTATTVEPQKLDAAVFKLPAKVKVAKTQGE